MVVAHTSTIASAADAMPTKMKKNRRKISRKNPNKAIPSGPSFSTKHRENAYDNDEEMEVVAPEPLSADAEISLDEEAKDGDDELMIDSHPSPLLPAGGAPAFPPVATGAEKTLLKSETRRVPIPPHRMTPLKKDWLNIFGPLTEILGLQVRMNVQRRCVEIRTSKHTKDIGSLQKGADFIKAYALGFDVNDAIALLRLDDLYLDSFEIKDVKTLHGDHLSRAIGRIAGQDGKTKFTIENTTRTRIVLADTKIHVMGSFQNIKIARDAIVSLILGSPPGKVYAGLRTSGIDTPSLSPQRTMCGILGLLLHDPSIDAAPEICEGLSLLQHRGQDACGIITCGPKGRFYQCKANGMVRDIFDVNSISRLIGGMGVGHVRYPTAGSFNNAEAQPFYVNSPYGIVFAHNGNLINTANLMQFMDQTAHRHINTASDSELLLNIFAYNLQQTGKFRINEEDIFTAIGGMMSQVKGAYACCAMLAGFGIIAFRDPNGIRPVGLATRKVGEHLDYIISSESVVADAGGFADWEDVKPGQAVIITRNGISRRQIAPPATFAPDIFEYVYFARPDSVMDGISVYRSRMAMGDALADQVKTVLEAANIKVDVVIPVPDTSRVAALNLAQRLNLPYREGFIKNRYVGRTFIMPGQQMRRKNVRRKLNAMALEFVDKNVLIVDDSIVRGTTSKEIIQMAKDVGAKKVIMASCAPPIRSVN
ncbi:unnamed protein product [Cyclocybe aegerita]|uniref:Pre-rRNA-processing protein PNO1 n=1 Tax=Cyclocybe aegerita TaxID=1973307 RepID=A0A8S0VV60_CYCAE|nr:unnamed protein product [Cyclocybe aegerita]